MRTYNDIYIDASKRLKKAGIEAASLEARLLLAYAADKTQEELLRDIRLYPGDAVERKAELFFERRLSGEPAAYILGEWEFCGLGFDVNPNVLIPRTDTELLPELLLRQLEGREKPRILDLCAGSGCIGLTAAARRTDLTAVLADVDERALIVCRRNALRHRLSPRAY
ncbi:MAG: methyltransferase, partial [Oscillospiraceae bacterium]|nr:methyltransferase [Oscillospiraceae bacterium]